MPGTVRAVIDGDTYTASRNYHCVQHSGAASDTRSFTPDWALKAMAGGGVRPGDLEGGDVTVVVDGVLASVGMSKWPSSETGSADESGFGFGGLDAHLDILNYGRTAQRSFSVRADGRGEHSGNWVTTVDGEVVERGATRPFQITWQAGDSDEPGFGVSL